MLRTLSQTTTLTRGSWRKALATASAKVPQSRSWWSEGDCSSSSNVSSCALCGGWQAQTKSIEGFIVEVCAAEHSGSHSTVAGRRVGKGLLKTYAGKVCYNKKVVWQRRGRGALRGLLRAEGQGFDGAVWNMRANLIFFPIGGFLRQGVFSNAPR